MSNRPPSRRVSFPCPTQVRRWQITGSDFEAWRDWNWVLLRSPSELQEAITLQGRVARHTDKELKRKPRFCARLIRDMRLRGLVSFGPPSEATIGVFVVPEKQGKQKLISDTRRVNQLFRRPWRCALPTPASWAGLQLPVITWRRLSWHLLEGQNTSFCQVCPLLLQEGVELPAHLLHLPDVSPQLQVLAVGLSWALSVKKMVESLRPVSWLLCGRLARGSSPGTCDVSGFNLLRGRC